MIEQVLTMKRTAALCLVGAFCSLNAQAQNIQVKGNLVDGTGEPLIGATVKVKGNASVGAVTDLDGNFSISVPSENSILVFTYVGMKTKEVKIGTKRELKLTLEKVPHPLSRTKASASCLLPALSSRSSVRRNAVMLCHWLYP